MTRPPRMLAGVFSAAKTGDVVALGPIPKPSNRRHTWIFIIVSLWRATNRARGAHTKS